MFRLRPLLFAFLVFLAASPVLHAAVKAKDLPPVYRHWLTQEVNYIIESTERNEFLSLRTDDERDAFMSSFWDSRNPNPGSDTNPYKEEHYRRLAFANDNFGNTQRGDGWATDQGMVYITLGPPQSKVTYPNSTNVRPIVIWFYQSPTPALPTYFSVVFYKRSIGEEYTIYSPYQDGPVKLITGLESGNDQVRALTQLQKSLGGEVARTTLSLLPSEPVDTSKYEPSMVSDALLASIRGLADNPLEIARVNLIRQREKVTASIFSTSNTPEATYTVVRDATGRATVDYFMRMPQPDTGIAGVRKSGGSGYDMTLQQHIVTEAGRPVYDTISSISAGGLQPNTLDVARHRVFAAEDQLPLEPGKYVVQSTLTNNLNLEAHRITTNIVVPARSKSLTLSTPVAYAGRPGHLEGDRVPFTYAGVRFAPLGVGTVTLHTGDPLQTVFQMWLPPTADGKFNLAPIALHFYYGSAAAGSKPIDEADDTVDPSNADEAGNIVSGHTFKTTDLPAGSYRVIIRATQAGSPPAFGTMTLRIVPAMETVAAWSAYGPPELQQEEMKRALSAEASGASGDAITYLRRDLDAHPTHVSSLTRLAALLGEQHKVAETAQLADRPAFRDAVDIPTLTLVSEALVQTGKPDRAIELLNTQSKLQPLNSSLYNQLATLDDKAGKRSEGDLARHKATELSQQ